MGDAQRGHVQPQLMGTSRVRHQPVHATAVGLLDEGDVADGVDRAVDDARPQITGGFFRYGRAR